MIESTGPVSNFLNSTIAQKKGLIPIRSVLYRKNSDPSLNRKRNRAMSNLRMSSDVVREELDSIRRSVDHNLNIVKSGYNRTSVFFKNSPDQEVNNANISVSTDINSNVNGPRPNLTITLHKLGAASRQAQVTASAGTRNISKLKKITRNPDDYMNLLFDESRVRFKKEDYEEVVDINQEQHMQRIYSQGFRDPEYFGTRSVSRMRNVLSEEEVRTSYNFKLPALISSMENPNAVVTHVLGSTRNDINFITDEIDRIKVEEDEIKQVKEEIRVDIERMKEEHQKELDDLYQNFKVEAAKMLEQLTEDFHEKQNHSFKLVKEISKLEREKIIIQGEIDHLILRMHNIEDNIFGKTLFTLEPTTEDKQLTQMNLRTEDRPKLTSTKIVH